MWMEMDVKLSDLAKLNGLSIISGGNKPMDVTCNKNEMRYPEDLTTLFSKRFIYFFARNTAPS